MSVNPAIRIEEPDVEGRRSDLSDLNLEYDIGVESLGIEIPTPFIVILTILLLFR